MKTVLAVIAAICLLQGRTHGHSVVLREATNPVMAAANSAIQTVSNLVQGVGKAIAEANYLVHKYSDNSTDYAAEYRRNSKVQVNEIAAINQRALAEASTGKNESVLSCITSKRSETQNLAITTAADVGRCAITKARQLADLTIDVANLANTTYNLIPTTKAKIKNCDSQPNQMFKIGCITWATAESSAVVAEVGIGVTKTLATATSLFMSFRPDLELCAKARMLVFRKKMAEIPMEIGICTSKAILG